MLRVFGPLVIANLVTWAVAIVLFAGNSVLLGAALLAYTLGLRHAVDADHIAAIDNATRKLMQDGQHPHRTGLYFSLGHSTVVWLASLGIAFAATATGPHMEAFRNFGGAIGTTVSVLFLFGIAAANIFVLKGLVSAIRRHRQGDTLSGEDLDGLLVPRGPYARLFKPLFRMVSRSRHMFAIGFLFGLGFDTATEIGVLGISAAAATHGLPVWSILIFPALFTAAMSLVDTLDSTLMTGAYGWAFAEPARKLYYNFTVTFCSVVVALIVGGIEAIALLPRMFQLGAGIQTRIAALSESLSGAGYGAIALFATLWLVSMWVYRRRADAAARAA